MAPTTCTLKISDDLLLCKACGTQYDVPCPASISDDLTFIPADQLPLTSCRVCDDPRQFVPPEGQMFTTLGRLRSSGEFATRVVKNMGDGEDSRTWEVWVDGKVGIGQRASLIRTPHGNVLWDLVAYLDQDFVDQINALGGLEFIIISHPHFYTTWADWSTTFECPVYLSELDAKDWANRTDKPQAQLRLLSNPHTELLPGLTAIIAGGHFPGSMMLHSSPPNTAVPSLFVADTIMNVPSSRNPDPAKPGVSTYAFVWSIPNMIPLDPDTVLRIWRAIEPYEFVVTYSVMRGVGEVRERTEQRMSLKQRVLESAKIHCRHAGYTEHPIFAETC